jgi:hypothetical protein
MLDKQDYNAKQENLLLEMGGWFEAALTQNFAFMTEKLGCKKNGRKQARRNVVEDERTYFMQMVEVFAKRLERARRKKFTFLLVGRAGAKRAKPINVLIGEEVMPEDEQLHDTFQVTTYEHNEGESKFSIIDTPGLCNISTERGKDYTYQTRLEDGAPRFDGLLFVSPLLEAGITDGERRAIELITQAYGSDAWRYSLIILTYDGALEQKNIYQKLCQEKMGCIRQEIARLVGEGVAAAVPAVPVACAAKITPDGKAWLSELYVAISTRISDQGYLSFLLRTVKRLRFSVPKSHKKAVRSNRISTHPSQRSSTSMKNQENFICIDEEKSRAIRQRMRDYLTTIAKRNKISFS